MVQSLGLTVANMAAPASHKEPSPSPAKEEGAPSTSMAQEGDAVAGVGPSGDEIYHSEPMQAPEGQVPGVPTAEDQDPDRKGSLASRSPEPAAGEHNSEIGPSEPPAIEPPAIETDEDAVGGAGNAAADLLEADVAMSDVGEAAPASKSGAGEAALQSEERPTPEDDEEMAEAGKFDPVDSRQQSREGSVIMDEPGSPAAELPQEVEAQLRVQWEGLKAKVEALRHVERYKVASVAYRRCVPSLLNLCADCTPCYCLQFLLYRAFAHAVCCLVKHIILSLPILRTLVPCTGTCTKGQRLQCCPKQQI